MSNFDNAFDRVTGHEGGFQNDTGWTRRVVQNLRYAAEDN